MIPDLPPPILVQDGRGLERMLADLERASEIGLDTEADSFFNYREKVCLVQVTAGESDYLVDPLAGLDLAPLGRVLADARRTKVFHDGEYDILILKRRYRFGFAGLFDTRVAAAALGEEAPGLASVLKAHFGIELDKSMQRSNWSQRPLSERQIRYARLDTRFLVPLMHRQKEALAARGRTRVVAGECRRLEQIEPVDEPFDPDEFARLKGARALDPLGLQCLRELFVLRERLAEQADLPPFKVLSNEVLIALAAERPRSAREIGSARGLSPRQARRYGSELLAAVERARALGPLPRLPQLASRDGTHVLSEEEFELHERLKVWRKERARREGYDASLVINRHVLVRLAREKPRDLARLAAVEGMQDWQVEQFGADVVELFARSLAEFAREGVPRAGRRAFRGGSRGGPRA